MRILGKASLSSFLGGVITCGFMLGVLGGLFLIGSFILVLQNSNDLSEMSMTVTFELPTENLTQIPMFIPGKIDFGLRRLWGEYQYLRVGKDVVVLIFSGYFILLGFYFFGISQLIKLFDTLKEGEPFIIENAKRINKLGWCIILGCVFNVVYKIGGMFYVFWNVDFEHISFPRWSYLWSELHPVALFAGFVIMVIAEIFRKGTQLKEDQALTI